MKKPCKMFETHKKIILKGESVKLSLYFFDEMTVSMQGMYDCVKRKTIST